MTIKDALFRIRILKEPYADVFNGLDKAEQENLAEELDDWIPEDRFESNIHLAFLFEQWNEVAKYISKTGDKKLEAELMDHIRKRIGSSGYSYVHFNIDEKFVTPSMREEFDKMAIEFQDKFTYKNRYLMSTDSKIKHFKEQVKKIIDNSVIKSATSPQDAEQVCETKLKQKARYHKDSLKRKAEGVGIDWLLSRWDGLSATNKAIFGSHPKLPFDKFEQALKIAMKRRSKAGTYAYGKTVRCHGYERFTKLIGNISPRVILCISEIVPDTYKKPDPDEIKKWIFPLLMKDKDMFKRVRDKVLSLLCHEFENIKGASLDRIDTWIRYNRSTKEVIDLAREVIMLEEESDIAKMIDLYNKVNSVDIPLGGLTSDGTVVQTFFKNNNNGDD